MQSAQLISQLLDLGLSHILFMLRPRQLLRHIFKVSKNMFQRLADSLYLSLGL
jgi:hypothetical protein